ncbi:MAG: single-stranded DNA-binding protein [Actinomycetota bacterium]
MARSTVKSTVKSKSEEFDSVLRNPRNEVYLEGRVSNLPTQKQLPSGDTVVEFRIVIDRRTKRGTKREVDTLDVAVWLAKSRKSALSLCVDDWVAVEGAVRRRFWKAPTGLASRWQVEASQLRRL